MSNNSTTSALSGLDPSLTASSSESSAKVKRKAGDTQVTGTEFLNLLVEQLKNQDPLNPMDNQQFAVQLSQFSSLEQLISINDKVGTKDTTDSFGSLASYLRQEIVTKDQSVTINGRDAPSVSFNLPNDATGVQIDLLDSSGAVAATSTTDALTSGRHSVSLEKVQAADGDYKIRITANKASGGTEEVAGYSSGIVSGFIPGLTPKLILNGREIGTADIREVHAVQQ